MKLSVIIPTMQKNTKILLKLLKNISQDKVVDEIILIDNAGKGFDKDILNVEKVVPVINAENRYVNPTWNQGVELAKNEYWALLNDDILVSDDFCTNVVSKIKPSMGIIGVATDSVQTLNPDLVDNIFVESAKDLKLKVAKQRNLYFGTAMFGSKKAYYKIPEELLIWYGDDYLFKMNNKKFRKNYNITNVKIYHLHSLTSKRPEFQGILKKEEKLFSEVYVPKLYTIFERIFSVKNNYENGKKNKNLYLLGLKINLSSKENYDDKKDRPYF